MPLSDPMFRRLVLLASLALAACNESSSREVGRLSRRVGPAGASLSLPGGAALEIPAGALASEIELGVELLIDPVQAGYAPVPGFVDGAPAISLALTPHGTTFEQAVTLKLPYSGAAANLVVLRAADAHDETWEAIGPVVFADGLATISITAFSTYTLAQVKAGSCPCFDGDMLSAFFSVGAGWPAAEAMRSHSAQEEFVDRATGAPMRFSHAMADFFKQGEQTMKGRRVGVGAYLTEPVNGPAPQKPGSCDLFRNSEDTRDPTWATWFPAATIPPVTDSWAQAYRVELDASQALACMSLIARTNAGIPARQLAFWVEGLPSDGAVVVGLKGEGDVRLDVNDTLVWGLVALAEGSAFEVDVRSQPATAACTAVPASGTLAANTVVKVICEPTSAAITCTAVDGLACPGFSYAGCIADVSGLRGENGNACAIQFDGLLACIVAKLNPTPPAPPSAGCDASEPQGWEMAHPSPCQVEFDAWEACGASQFATIAEVCTGASTLGCASFDQSACVTELESGRMLRFGGCTAEFDAWTTCAEADPGGAFECTSGSPYFKGKSGGTCATELATWTGCVDP